MKFNFKSKSGFTLIELLVVIGILAVLAAIAIPSVAGLIDRANVSSDATNANEMTNAVERFTTEYELYLQDIASGRLDTTNLDSAQGRVYNVTGITDRAGIEALEKDTTAGPDTTGKAIYRDTKYPVNAETMQAVVENYMKTSSSTFTPKQSDKHFWYSPEIGVVVVAKPNANVVTDLNIQVQSGNNAKGEELDGTTIWIDITISESAENNTNPPLNDDTHSTGLKFYQPYLFELNNSNATNHIWEVYHENGGYDCYSIVYFADGSIRTDGGAIVESGIAIGADGSISWDGEVYAKIEDNGNKIVGTTEYTNGDVYNLVTTTPKSIQYEKTYVYPNEDYYIVFHEDGTATVDTGKGAQTRALSVEDKYYYINGEKGAIHPNGEMVLFSFASYGHDVFLLSCDNKNTEVINKTATYSGDLYCHDCGRVVKVGQKASIEFRIFGTTYTTKPNTTWQEWINSSSNTIGLFVDSDGVVRFGNESYEYLDCSTAGGAAKADAFIIEGCNYNMPK